MSSLAQPRIFSFKYAFTCTKAKASCYVCLFVSDLEVLACCFIKIISAKESFLMIGIFGSVYGCNYAILKAV